MQLVASVVVVVVVVVVVLVRVVVVVVVVRGRTIHHRFNEWLLNGPSLMGGWFVLVLDVGC